MHKCKEMMHAMHEILFYENWDVTVSEEQLEVLESAKPDGESSFQSG